MGEGTTGVLRTMGPTPTEGEATIVGSPVARGSTTPPSLAGTMTMTVNTNPQQNASNDAPTMPPMVRASFDLDFILYLSRLPTYIKAASISKRSNTVRSTLRKTAVKLTAGARSLATALVTE